MISGNLKHWKKRMLLVAAICACLTGVYWLKNASGINLFGDLSLSAHFPFSLLKLEPSVHHERGSVTIDEDFQSLLPIPIKWWKLHTPAPDSIRTSYVKACPDSSRCLMVTSLSDQRWHITHRYRIAVRKNDRFYLQGMLWSKSNGGDAAVQVSGFDAQGQIIERNMWHIESSIQGEFEKIKGVFTVAPGVTSIRLRLAGKGQGEFKFDNILLQPLVSGG